MAEPWYERRAGAQAQMLVRRYTDELPGNTALERETKNAQRRADEEEEACRRRRMRKLLDTDGNQTDEVFDKAEIARDALRQCCERFSAQPHKTDKESIIRTGKVSARIKAERPFRQCMSSSIDEFRGEVLKMEEEWKSRHSKAYEHITNICKSLDSHKAVFALFPSQSAYTSVLCGSLSMLVQAAANHDKISETLSKSVAEVSSRAALCAKLLDVIDTDSMRARLVDIYANVFHFFCDVMEWYHKSRTSRFFQSFNEKFDAKLVDVVKLINDQVSDMHKEGAVRGLAMKRKMLFQQSELNNNNMVLLNQMCQMRAEVGALRAEVSRQRQSPQELGLDVGNSMIRTLLSNCETFTITSVGSKYIISRKGMKNDDEETVSDQINEVIEPTKEITVPRRQALMCAKHLGDFVVGGDGLDLISDHMNLLAEFSVVNKLRDWLSDTGESQLLWISGPWEAQSVSSARAASIAIVAAAVENKAPFISHFCEKPRKAFAGITPQRAGLLGLLYSLIHQLLQFNIDDSGLDLQEKRLRQLNGTENSWDQGLQLLSDLLLHTISVPYCVIHGLNDLEFSNGSEWCGQLLRVLLGRQGNSSAQFNILLTTSGQSRVLSQWVPSANRHIADHDTREVEKRGVLLELQHQMEG